MSPQIRKLTSKNFEEIEAAFYLNESKLNVALSASFISIFRSKRKNFRTDFKIFNQGWAFFTPNRAGGLAGFETLKVQILSQMDFFE